MTTPTKIILAMIERSIFSVSYTHLAFIEDILGKKLGKAVPVLQVAEGIITAWVPGVLMLVGKW